MRDILRARLPLLLSSLALLATLQPTPNYRPLQRAVAEVRRAARMADPLGALNELEWILSFQPQLTSLHLVAARYALAAGRPDKASAHLSHARSAGLSPETIECLTSAERLQEEDLPGALAAWRAAPQGCLQETAILRDLSEALWGARDYDAARDVLIALTAAEPDNQTALTRLALLEAVRDPRSALRALAGLDPPPPERALALGLRQHLGLLGQDKSLAFQLAQVGKFYAQHGQWHLAKMAFRNAVSLAPDYSEALAYLGLAIDQTGGNGLGALRYAARLQPEDPFVRLLLGMHWLKHGEPQLAIEELYLASQLDPTNPHIASQMGAAYEALGQTRTALQAYHLATELAPQDPTFWVLLARAGLRLEPNVEAVAMPAARRALQLDPHNASALDCLGFAYLLLEDRPMAQRFLLRALASDPNLAETHYHLGLFYVTGEDYAAARAAFQRAAQLDPGGPVGALALRSLENIFP